MYINLSNYIHIKLFQYIAKILFTKYQHFVIKKLHLIILYRPSVKYNNRLKLF